MASNQFLSTAPFRSVERVLTSRLTIEGEGVRLKRAFADDKLTDPFLLLDEFHSHNPSDYSAGFPWHPHRGFETVTYVLEGSIEHRDSAGNEGVIGAGGVQWMTAGSGIVHQEMPRGDELKRLWGLQLWVNLPAAHKMISPKYRGIAAEEIPEVQVTEDAKVRTVSGTIQGKMGPVRDLTVDCQLLDVTLDSSGIFEHALTRTHRAFAYVLDGDGFFDAHATGLLGPEHTAVYGNGEKVRIEAASEKLRFLLISGEPIGEPVAWRGSIVMNTKEELDKAYEELEEDQFLK